MATRVCPQCGTQYVASVRRCIDCDAMLVDETGPDGETVPSVATPLGVGDQIAYELDGWGNQLRQALAGMLDLNNIAYVWEAGALVVAAPHEKAVDECIAAVEGIDGEELDPETPQIEFEIEGVSADELSALDAELIAAHVPHAWQETGELLVPQDCEDLVAEMIDAVLNPDDDEVGDGLATHTALDGLYVAVDKLGKDPADQKLVKRFVAAADGLDDLAVPYGLSGNDWQALLSQVAEVRQLVTDAPKPAEDQIDEADDAEVDAEADDDAVAGADRLERARDLIGRLRGGLLDLV